MADHALMVLKTETAYFYGEPIEVPVPVADYVRELLAERLELYNRVEELEARLGMRNPA